MSAPPVSWDPKASEPVAAAHGPGELVRFDDEVGAEVRGQSPLLSVLGADDERERRCMLARGRCHAEAEGACTEHRHDRAGCDIRHDGMHRAGRRLDHHGRVVTHVVGHCVEL